MVHSDSDTFSFACDALLLRVGGFALKVLRRTILGQVDVVLVGKFELFNLAIESVICKKNNQRNHSPSLSRVGEAEARRTDVQTRFAREVFVTCSLAGGSGGSRGCHSMGRLQVSLHLLYGWRSLRSPCFDSDAQHAWLTLRVLCSRSQRPSS
jgi:hypothetical protein